MPKTQNLDGFEMVSASGMGNGVSGMGSASGMGSDIYAEGESDRDVFFF